MDPDHGGVALLSPLLQGLKHVSRDVHVPDTAPVRDLLVVHHTLGDGGVDAVGAGFALDGGLVVADGMVFPPVAHIEGLHPGRVHLHHLPGPLGLEARRGKREEQDSEKTGDRDMRAEVSRRFHLGFLL